MMLASSPGVAGLARKNTATTHATNSVGGKPDKTTAGGAGSLNNYYLNGRELLERMWVEIYFNVIEPPPGSAAQLWSTVLVWFAFGMLLEWGVNLRLLFILSPTSLGRLGGEEMLAAIMPFTQAGGSLFILWGVVGVCHKRESLRRFKGVLIVGLLNMLAFQLLRFLASFLLMATLSIPNATTSVLFCTILLPLLFDFMLLGLTELPYLRWSLLRNPNSSFLSISSLFFPKTVSRSISDGDEQPASFQNLQQIISADDPEYTLSVMAPWTLSGGLLASIPSRLALLSAPSPMFSGPFLAGAIVLPFVRTAVLIARVKLATRKSVTARVTALSEEMLSERYLVSSKKTRVSESTRKSVTSSNLSRENLQRRHFPPRVSLPLLALTHLATSMASQAAIGIAVISLLLMPDMSPQVFADSNTSMQDWSSLVRMPFSGGALDPITFLQSNYTPLTMGAVSLMTTMTVMSSANVSHSNNTVVPRSIPVMAQTLLNTTMTAIDAETHLDAAPMWWTLVCRSILLLCLDWLAGVLFASLVSSPTGILYGASTQPNDDVRPLSMNMASSPVISASPSFQLSSALPNNQSTSAVTASNHPPAPMLTPQPVHSSLRSMGRSHLVPSRSTGRNVTTHTFNTTSTMSHAQYLNVDRVGGTSGLSGGGASGFGGSVAGFGGGLVGADSGGASHGHHGHHHGHHMTLEAQLHNQHARRVSAMRMSFSKGAAPLIMGDGQHGRYMAMQAEQAERLRVREQINMVDPRPFVVSVFEFVRAMGAMGVALAWFWGTVWGVV
ncbi:hypothetical protein HK101_008795 [Irineochytrium annulatum]|nr:hypothetical protein HK101_008795 [Irineochytrium annulatum]